MAGRSELHADQIDRGLGCFLGLAVGDALGASLEFTERDRGPLHSEMSGGGPFDLEPGQWTDDTSMALAMADSLIRSRAFDPLDIMTRFLDWKERGTYSSTGRCFDIGNTTSNALFQFKNTGNPFSGSEHHFEAGNGSIMRLAPIVLFSLGDPEHLRTLACDQSRLTHGATDAVEACELLAVWLHEAIVTGDPALLQRSVPWSGKSRRVPGIAGGSFREKDRSEIRSTGYCIDTLEAAVWAVFKTSSFEEALILAVNLGGDSDTVGAVAGQIAGALYGLSVIPSRWLEPLTWRERLETTARQLLTATD